MEQSLAKTWKWLRSHLELGVVGSILVGVSTYVGSFFYESYFGFYFLDGADIRLPLEDSVRTFAIVLLISGALLAFISTVNLERTVSIRSAFIDNIPIFFVVLPVGVWAVAFYWDNVIELSSWLSRTVTSPSRQLENTVLTLRVTNFLRKALFVAPLVLGLVTVVTLSCLKISFSVYLMKHNVQIRIAFLALFVIVTLTAASLCGKAYANLEFYGVFDRPEIKITLTDGSAFQAINSLYLLTESNGVYYVARRPDASDRQVRAWLVPRAAVKSIEVHAPAPSTVPLLDLIGNR